MVKVGPWTVQTLERYEDWYTCERCDTESKEIWVCEVDDSDEERLAQLDGQRVWRIGSTCGPILLKVSRETWKQHVRGIEPRLEVMKRFVKLVAAAERAGLALPALILERGPLVGSDVSGRGIRHLGFVMTRWERRLGLRE